MDVQRGSNPERKPGRGLIRMALKASGVSPLSGKRKNKTSTHHRGRRALGEAALVRSMRESKKAGGKTWGAWEMEGHSGLGKRGVSGEEWRYSRC